MNLFRYLLTALIMYRSPREGRQPATCCGCGCGPVRVLLWGQSDWDSRYETYCAACATDSWVVWSEGNCTVAPLTADALTNDQADAAAVATWPTRTLIPSWLTSCSTLFPDLDPWAVDLARVSLTHGWKLYRLPPGLR